MATDDLPPTVRARLPEHPDLAQLKNRARDRRRGTPGLTLAQAQLAVARDHGFASWPRLKRHVEAITSRSWSLGGAAPDGRRWSPADLLADRACLTWASDRHDEVLAAGRELRADPTLASSSLLAAVVAGDAATVAAMLDADPPAAARPLGPRGWSPLMYLAYARTDASREAVLDTAAALLDGGADPDDGRFFAGLATPFTVLTGVLGGGERGEPAHPHALDLAGLLLERGADPNDAQALYDLQFGTDDRPLELLLRHGLGRGDGGPWRRLLPDLLVSPRALLRRLLRWSVEHDQRDRVALLVAHGVDVSAVTRSTSSRYLALVNGHRELADLLGGLGVAAPELDAADAFVAGALAGDRDAAAATPPDVVAAVRARRPGLVVWAAGLGRVAAIDALLDAGFDVDALGRGDAPIEQPWQTALHTAVEHDDPAVVRRLLERGADPTVRDARFDGTPLNWADHLGLTSVAAVLRAGPAG